MTEQRELGRQNLERVVGGHRTRRADVLVHDGGTRLARRVRVDSYERTDNPRGGFTPGGKTR